MEQPQEKPRANHVLRTPFWVMILRGLQFFISLVIVGICGRMMHDAYMEEHGFNIAIAILTWLAVAYAVFTEKIPSLNSAYHILTIIIADGLLVILWLAAWASTAAKRAKYVVPVNVDNCYDDGSNIDSKYCDIVYKRHGGLDKRSDENVILTKLGLALFSTIAGLGALVWVLFIATFVYTLIMFLRGRKEGRFPIGSGSVATTPSNNYQMETKISETQPALAPQPGYQAQPQTQQYQQPAPGQFAPQQQQQFPQGAPAPAPYQQAQSPFQQTQSPYQQQGAYPPPAQAPYSPQEQPQQQNYGQYPPQQPQAQPQAYQQPVQHQHTGQSQPYGSELDGQSQYTTPPPAATSPPPQHYQQPQPYPAQAYPQQ
ncbi:hypothetical protein FDECE_65 [Fusarium decemcellulare]|nr:hypothetical protein FDECE_65 [Fusarium decemcellulare]